MAKAAKMSDSGCECANLVIAAAASGNANWGSRKEKLAEINTQLLSSEEKAWYDLLVETTKGEENSWDDVYSEKIEKFLKSKYKSKKIVINFNKMKLLKNFKLELQKNKYGRYLLLGSFAFFFIKGLIWLGIFIAVGLGITNSF